MPIFFIDILITPIILLKNPRLYELYLNKNYLLFNNINYEHAFIGFDGGVFILLNLSNADTKKTLLIFKDQLSNAEYRMLRLIRKQ